MVVASQLTAKVSTEGVDTAKSQLQGMGQSVRDVSSTLGGGGLFGAVTGAIGGLLNFGSQVGMTIFGLKNLASGAISLGSSLLQPAATAETTQLSFETLLHSTKAAHQEMMDLNTFAASTPMQTQWVDNAAAKILAFGGTTKDVIPEITAIGDSLSGLGKLSDTSLNSIVDIFGKISAQGKLTGGDMMQLSTWGIPAWQALSDSMHKPIPELQNMVSAGLIPADTAIKALEGGMEKTFGGGMAKQANTFTGIISTLASNWQIAMAALGTPVLELVEGQLSNIGGILSSSAFQDFATNVGQRIANVFTSIGSSVGNAGSMFNSLNLSNISSEFKQLGSSLNSEFGPQVKEIASLLQGQFTDSFKFAGQQASQISKWFQGSGIIKDMGQEFKNLAHVLLDLGEIVIRARGVIMDIEEHAFAKFAPYIEKILPPLIKFQAAIDTGIAGALQYVKPYIDQALTAFQKFADGVIDRTAPIIDKVMPYIILGVEEVQKMWVASWPYMQVILEGTFKTIVGIVQIAWAWISGIINIGLDLLSGNWKGAWKDMQDMLSGTLDGIKIMFGGQIQAWEGLFSGVGAFVDRYLVQPFRSALGQIGGIFGNIGKLISDATSGSWTAIPGDLHNLGLPGFASGTNYAPGGLARLAENGIELVTGPSVGYLPRGARVYSASQTAQMLSGSGSSSGPTTVILQVDRYQLGKVVLPLITDHVRLHTGVRI